MGPSLVGSQVPPQGCPDDRARRFDATTPRPIRLWPKRAISFEAAKVERAARVTVMNRLIVALLSVLIVLVAVNGVLVWRADSQARDDADRQACIQKAEATAVIALLAPASEVDVQGRINAIGALGSQVDGC